MSSCKSCNSTGDFKIVYVFKCCGFAPVSWFACVIIFSSNQILLDIFGPVGVEVYDEN